MNLLCVFFCRLDPMFVVVFMFLAFCCLNCSGLVFMLIAIIVVSCSVCMYCLFLRFLRFERLCVGSYVVCFGVFIIAIVEIIAFQKMIPSISNP